MRIFFFFKQKTAYEMRISDWSSDVCSSDLIGTQRRVEAFRGGVLEHHIAVVAWAQPRPIERRARVSIEAVDRQIHGGVTPGVGMGGLTTGGGIEPALHRAARHPRSEERRVGKECGSTVKSRWWPEH